MPTPYVIVTWAQDSMTALTWASDSIYTLSTWASETY